MIHFRNAIRPSMILSVVVYLATAAALAQAENWPRFRGSDGSGVSAEEGFPAEFSPGDFAWNREIPGAGHAAPIIWDDYLFVSSAVDEGAVRYLFCLDAHTGEERWVRATGLNRSHKHNKSSWASSTPATDGRRVYVAFADKEHHILAAYDFEGDLVWRRQLGRYESQHGQGTSPILYENLVILANDQDGPSSVVAFDCETGDTVWSSLRSIGVTSYASPLLIEKPGEPTQLICSSSAMGVTSLDPESGRLNWMTGELPARTVGSPVYAEGVIVQCCGGGGRGKELVVIDPHMQTDTGEERIIHRRERTLPYVPTPIVYQGHIYLWNDNGVVSCVDLKTYEDVWKERVAGNFTGSPICVDGKIYIVNEDGEVVVIDAAPEFKLHGRVPIGDASHSTPSVANGRLYFRTFHRLACLEAR